ncbi:hypothetical protein ACP4OV_002706 [Aristida adscensionis]
MAPFRRWADLPPDLLSRIGDRLDLRWYASARGACTAWRRALAPPSPPSSSPPRTPSGAPPPPPSPRGGPSSSPPSSPAAAASAPATAGSRSPSSSSAPRPSRGVSKVVFAPSPAKDDFAAAAICDIDRVAYVTAGARRWAIMDPVDLATGDQLTDVVYHDEGKVYCLTSFGDVHVLHLPERRRRKPLNADEAGTSEPEFSVLRPPADRPVSHRARRWQHHRKVPMIRYHHLRPRDLPQETSMRLTSCAEWLTSCAESSMSHRRVPPESQGPDLNAPATVEPLLSEGNLPFSPATAFAPPYDTVSAFASAKNLVFCDGSLYQVWRNASCTVTLQLPGGGQRRVAENEILVLRYYPRRQPCWDVVKDLGGYSLFVGRNNAVSMYAEGVPGLKGNCVYWIGGRGRDQGMVFDMETERSTPCRPPRVGTVPGRLHSTICWYFLSDVVNNGRT